MELAVIMLVTRHEASLVHSPSVTADHVSGLLFQVCRSRTGGTLRDDGVREPEIMRWGFDRKIGCQARLARTLGWFPIGVSVLCFHHLMTWFCHDLMGFRAAFRDA